jgi:hypothetical protein
MRFWRALLLAFAATHSCSAQDDTQRSDEPPVKAEPAVKGEVGRRFIGSTVIYDNYASFEELVIKSKDAWVIAVVPQANSEIEVNCLHTFAAYCKLRTFSLQRNCVSHESTLIQYNHTCPIICAITFSVPTESGTWLEQHNKINGRRHPSRWHCQLRKV